MPNFSNGWVRQAYYDKDRGVWVGGDDDYKHLIVEAEREIEERLQIHRQETKRRLKLEAQAAEKIRLKLERRERYKAHTKALRSCFRARMWKRRVAKKH